MGEPSIPPQNWEASLRDNGGSMAGVDDILQKMKRRFEETYEYVKEMRSDLFGSGKKDDAHAVSIKYLEI